MVLQSNGKSCCGEFANNYVTCASHLEQHAAVIGLGASSLVGIAHPFAHFTIVFYDFDKHTHEISHRACDLHDLDSIDIDKNEVIVFECDTRTENREYDQQ